jgi:ketosteroid isomerase-like protein
LQVQRGEIESLRRGYEALHRGDFAAVFELLDPEIEIRDRPESPDAGTHRGHEGALAVFQQSVDTFQEMELAPEELIELGDQVLAVVRLRGRGRGSGVPIDERVTHLWTFRDGRAVSMQIYTHKNEALEAARERERGLPRGPARSD